jgi:hypothetical protein
MARIFGRAAAGRNPTPYAPCGVDRRRSLAKIALSVAAGAGAAAGLVAVASGGGVAGAGGIVLKASAGASVQATAMSLEPVAVAPANCWTEPHDRALESGQLSAGLRL